MSANSRSKPDDYCSANLGNNIFEKMQYYEIINAFGNHSTASSTPSETVDKQLFPTKKCCLFTQCMDNKPDKFGIKFWVALANSLLVNKATIIGIINKIW